MNFHFYKYQGTGNDFVLIDDRQNNFDTENLTRIQKICDRKFGVGSDGLILIRKHVLLDFTMIFFNPDGSKSFCGNGSRCAVKFAHDSGIVTKNEMTFEAIDGNHIGKIVEEKVSISVNNPKECKIIGNDRFLNTGSPHYIRYVDAIEKTDVTETGKTIRYSKEFEPDGTNVNFVQKFPDFIKVRTYERGVENETLSCGSGVTASALSAALEFGMPSPVKVKTSGGDLQVSFKRTENDFSEIFLTGPAEKVFEGNIYV